MTTERFGPTKVAAELADPRARLPVATETLDAIRPGEVDGVVVAGPEGKRVFTLKGAEEPYRLLIEQMSEGAVTLSSEGTILYANEAFARLLQTPLGRVIGAELRSFVRPADQPTLARMIEEASSAHCHGGLSVRAADGSFVPLRLGMSRLHVDGAALLCVVAADLTEQNRKEEELHRLHADLEQRIEKRTAELTAARLAALNMMEDAVAARQLTETANIALTQEITARKTADASLRLFRTQVDFSKDAIAVIDFATGRFIDASKAAWGSLGYTSADLATLTVFDVVVGLKPATFEAINAQLAKTGRATFEADHRRKDGSTLPMEVNLSLVKLDRDYVVAILRDITERKATDAALRLGEERYRLLFEHSPLPMWAFDCETLRFLAVNDSAVLHYGYTSEEFLAMTLKDIRVVDDIPALEAAVATLDDSGRPREARHRIKNGSVIRVEVVTRRIDYDGHHAELALLSDITEKKLLEEKFLHAQRLESVGMLAAGIAHDLNNVLAPIVFAAPMLRVNMSDPSDLKILTTLEQSAARGAGLVKQILGFVQTGSSEFRPVQVKHIARDVVSVIEETFPKNIQCEQHIPSDLWPVAGSATQIHQVLLNLCVNARDAMPQGGVLRVAAANRQLDAAQAAAISGALPGAWLVLEVSDTGTGIPPDLLEQIWTPFFSTKAAGVGTGLGLSTVRGIVLRHQGFVELLTAVGQGSTFRVYLPAIKSAQTEASMVSPAASIRGQRELILVVEDEEPIRDIIVAIIEDHGYRAVGCADGVEALAFFNTQGEEIALVVTDVDMPRIGGLALSRALLQLRPDLPIIAMSGASRGFGNSSGLAEFQAQSLAQSCLRKPFVPHELLTAIHQLLHPSPKT